MNTLHNRDRDLSDYGQDEGQDREISLGTGTILGIFFALALLCAVFFGFGYSMGRKSAQTVVNTADGSQGGSIFSNFRPSAGKPAAGQGSPSNTDSSTAVETNSGSADGAEDSSTGSDTAPAPMLKPVSSVQTPVVSQTTPANGLVGSQSAAAEGSAARVSGRPSGPGASSMPMPAASANGTMIVQIAAVSHQEDADLLLSALKQRGYPVFLRQEPQDQLIHVQVGPFASKKDADAMRQRLLADGYNAILK